MSTPSLLSATSDANRKSRSSTRSTLPPADLRLLVKRTVTSPDGLPYITRPSLLRLPPARKQAIGEEKGQPLIALAICKILPSAHDPETRRRSAREKCAQEFNALVSHKLTLKFEADLPEMVEDMDDQMFLPQSGRQSTPPDSGGNHSTSHDSPEDDVVVLFSCINPSTSSRLDNFKEWPGREIRIWRPYYTVDSLQAAAFGDNTFLPEPETRAENDAGSRDQHSKTGATPDRVLLVSRFCLWTTTDT
jgi:hypothetical protein